MTMPRIQLVRGREKSIHRRHPWIFSGSVAKMDQGITEGDIAEITDFSGHFLAYAFYEGGSIAAKIISFEKTEITSEFWQKKLKNALEYRERIGLINNPNTNVFRLCHGEGDNLPGLIIDVYDDIAVIQPHAKGIKVREQQLAELLCVTFPKIKAVLSKSTASGNKENHDVKWLLGTPKPLVQVCENGILFMVDVEKGQKTGFFIDQRQNRLKLAQYSKDKDVLNTFSYTGGFSCYALTSGAKSVTSIDLGNNAMSLLDQNVSLTGFSQQHTSLQKDVFEFFQTINSCFDIIILDPPAFAKHNSAKHNAIQAYKRLNTLALEKLNPGGFLFTFSCSQVITPDLFEGTVTSAAIETGFDIRMVERLFQSPDHPWNIYHPEGLYLKGLLLYKAN